MRKLKRERSWALALFGLPFFGVGVGFLVLSVLPTLNEGWQMASWPSTTGTLTHARLLSSTSDGTTTYGVEASYRYRVASHDYRNDRVAINSGNDNIGSFQQQLGARLEQHYRNNRPVTVYYNPADPADAVLDRTLRWDLLVFKLIFVIVFGGAGLGMLLYALRGRKVVASPEAVNKPWLIRAEWAENRIRSGARKGLYFIWAFAIFWNLVSAPAIYGFLEVREEEGMLAYLILIFPAVGLLLLSWAIRASMAWRRFGYTPLTLDPFPGAIGGDVGGEVFLNIPFDPQIVCEVTLSSLYSYVSGSGKSRSRHERVEWQDSGFARVERAAKGSRLLFRFSVPTGKRESEEHSDGYYLWRLNIASEIPGIDLDRSFEIPVYNTGERSRMIKLDSANEVPPGSPQLRAEALLPLRQNGIATELYYPMLRRITPAFLGILFGAVFAGVGLILWGMAPQQGGQLYFMGAVFSAVGSIVVLGALYSALNALRIELDGRQITVTRTLLGIPISTRQAAYHEVRDVEIKSGMTTQQSNKHKVNYKVVAHSRNGELQLAEQLGSHSKAKLVAGFFRDKLNLKPENEQEESEFVVEVE